MQKSVYQKSFLAYAEQNEYSNEIPPAFMALETVSFGTLSKLYKFLKYPCIDKAAMGFPADWQKEPLWGELP